jgi:hypothetical protein
MLDDRVTGVRFQAGERVFLPLNSVQTGSGDHPRTINPRVKWLGRENWWSYTSI